MNVDATLTEEYVGLPRIAKPYIIDEGYRHNGVALRSYAPQGCDPTLSRIEASMQEGTGTGSVGDMLGRFLDDAIIAGRSPQTVASYKYKLRARLPLALPVHDLDSDALRAILTWEVRNRAPNSATTLYGALSSYCSWLVRQGVFAVSPMRQIPKPKPPEPDAVALTRDQVARLWQAAEELDGAESGTVTMRARVGPPTVSGEDSLYAGSTARFAKDHRRQSTTYRLILLLLATTGMRRGELAGLRYEDIDGDTAKLLGKGRKYRRVILSPECLALIGSGHGPVIDLSGKRIGARFKMIAVRAGLPKAHPHLLRHTYFSEFIKAGGQIEAARILGGWQDTRQLVSRYARGTIEDAALDEARRIAAQHLR